MLRNRRIGIFRFSSFADSFGSNGSNMSLDAQTLTASDHTRAQSLGVLQLLNDQHLNATYSKYLDRSTYAATLQPMEDAWSLFPEVYTDPAFARLELEKVFKQSWVALDHKSDALQTHGDVVSTSIGDTPLLITNHHGILKAFYNVCRHRGSILLKEGKYSKCNVIRCPYHSWGYSCDGKLAGAPYFNDDKMPKNKLQRNDPSLTNEMFEFKKINFNKQDYSLFEIGVKEFMGTLFVNLDADTARREALWQYQFGDLNENYGHYPYSDMRVVEQYKYSIQANWKLIAENFIEYYHLPWVHPELCMVSSVANHIRRQGAGQYTGFATYPLTYGNTPADPDAFAPFSGLNASDLEAAWFLQIFPNISYFIFPHHIITLICYPTKDPGVTAEKMTVLMDKSVKQHLNDVKDLSEAEDAVKEKVKKLTDFYQLVNDQDIEAVESVQRGLQSTGHVYRGGRLSAKFEEPIYRFQHILVDYMTDCHMKEYPGDHDFVPSQFVQKAHANT